MKKFNIKVNGISYEVEIEEVKDGAPQAAAPKIAAPKVTPKVAAPKVEAPKAAPAKSKEAVAAGAGEHSIDAPMPGKIPAAADSIRPISRHTARPIIQRF